MAQELGVYQDAVSAGGLVVIQSNVQVIVTELYTVGPGGVLVIQDGGKLVIVP